MQRIFLRILRILKKALKELLVFNLRWILFASKNERNNFMSNLDQQFPSRNVFLISSNQPDSFFVFETFVVYEASFLYLSLIRLGFFKVVFLGVNLTRFPLYISWKANRQYQFNIIKLLKQPTQRGMKAKKLSWHDMSSADVISIFCYKKMSKKKLMKIDHTDEENLHIFRTTMILILCQWHYWECPLPPTFQLPNPFW